MSSFRDGVCALRKAHMHSVLALGSFCSFSRTWLFCLQPQVKPEERRSPVCTRIRLKIFPFFLRAREAVNMFPACIQVSRASLPVLMQGGFIVLCRLLCPTGSSEWPACSLLVRVDFLYCHSKWFELSSLAYLWCWNQLKTRAYISMWHL